MGGIHEGMWRDRVMRQLYEIAGHCFCVSGQHICDAVRLIDGFRPFEVASGMPVFSFEEGLEPPQMSDIQHVFSYEDVTASFGRHAGGYLLALSPAEEDPFFMWCCDGESMAYFSGNWSVRLYRFALWVAFGLMVLPYGTVAVHGSCIVNGGRAVLFLGESGTGKSTHTRIWREHIEGSVLLNDDSPILRVEGGKVWAYGSPWSGKTPCYKSERHELKACVRLSQAPQNIIRKLSVLHAYGALHPSCPPLFAYDGTLYDKVSSFIGGVLTAVPVYHLECLPDKEAAITSFRAVFP